MRRKIFNREYAPKWRAIKHLHNRVNLRVSEPQSGVGTINEEAEESARVARA